MKRLFVALFAGAFLIVSSFSASAFTDVSEGMFYYDSVDFLKNEGIVVGYGDGSFGYESNINRAELLKIVVEAKFFDEGTESLNSYGAISCFNDVPANEWYTKYVCYAKEMDWIVGYSDGTFKPAQNINFVEAMKIVMEVFGVDYPAGDPWYKGLVETASEQNLIPLTVDDFGLIISRAEMADMITRKIMIEDGGLEGFLGELNEYVVTYESIDANTNVAADVPSVGVSSGEILDDKCYVIFNVIGGVYEGFDCGGSELYDDLEFSPAFQSLFPDANTYVVDDEAVRLGDVFYFALKQTGGDVAIYNRLVSYDMSSDDADVLYVEESVEGNALALRGLDLSGDVLVVSWEGPNFLPPICWSPWVDEELYSADMDGGSESLDSYVPSQWKTDEEQEMVDDCWLNI